MSLKDSLAREHAHGIRKGPTCHVCALLSTLDRPDAAALTAALDDPTFTHTGISRALRDSDIKVSAATVSRHRNQECKGR